MKKGLVEVEVVANDTRGLYGKRGIIRDCYEEEGYFFYLVKVKGMKGLWTIHEYGIRIL